MHRNPGMLVRAAGSLLRPTAGAVWRAPTNTAWIPPPTRRLLLSARSRAYGGTYYGKEDTTVPADIKEQSGGYEYLVDVPGLSASDLRVELEPNRVLQVIGERLDEEPCVRYIRKDRPMGMLEEYFVLPQDADLARVSAVCRDGVLKVTVQKVLPFEIPRAIKVVS